MPGFGPFLTHSDALLAACPKILSFDNATITRPTSPHLRFIRSTPKEYCAWIYATPDGRYEMSLAAMNAIQREVTCRLPDHVLDRRYADESLGYVFAIHNHPWGKELSFDDIGFIVEEARIHGLTVKTQDKELDLGIAAFFAAETRQEENPCGGFYLYLPRTGVLSKWRKSEQGSWEHGPYARVLLREKATPPGFDIKVERVTE